MSFILDAIAKSERERQQQKIPDARILAMPEGNTQRPGRNLIYYLLGILMVGLILLLILLQTDRSLFNRLSQSGNKTFDPGSIKIVQENKLDLQHETSNLEITDTTAALEQVVEIPVAKTEFPEAKASILEPDRNVSRLSRKPNQQDQTPVQIKDTRAALDVEIAPTPPQKIENIGNDSINKPDVFADEQLANQTGIETVAKPAPRKITRLNELPSDVRRDLPSVAFTGHLYSKNVNLSYVMVDGGRTVIAGQQIADELFLHKVTPNGAIVDFRGFLIETGILQNWSLK